MEWIIFVVVLGVSLANGDSGVYNYIRGDQSGPAHWPRMFPECDSLHNPRQSPVNIDPDQITYQGHLHFPKTNDFDQELNWKIKNTGKTLYASPSPAASGNDPIVDMTTEVEGKTYVVAQFHFHWGQPGSMGSEHTIDGKQYHAELHIVHRPSGFADLGAALAARQDLLVLGFMITVGDEENVGYSPITDYLNNVNVADSEMEIRFPLSGLLPKHLYCQEAGKCPVFMYDGGLTTPNCTGLVKWVLSGVPVHISMQQMNKFYSLLDHHSAAIKDNWRPIQELGSRFIRTNWPGEKGENTDHGAHVGLPGLASSMSTSVLLLFGLVFVAIMF